MHWRKDVSRVSTGARSGSTRWPLSPIFAKQNLPTTVACIYLFNPYSLALGSGDGDDLAHALGCRLQLRLRAALGAVAASTLCLAIATYLSVYPVVLADSHRAAAPGRYSLDIIPWICLSLTASSPFFLLVFHIHPLIYVAPLYLRLRHTRPSETPGSSIAFVSIHPKTVMNIKNRFVYALGLGVATCMLPVMWFLWLFPASGNANFFYNQTLVYQVFLSQLIGAFVSATMKRDKDVERYVKRKQATDKSDQQSKDKSE
ncbi:hypothetical protein PINS_up021775 [Pythium insidiosum]|nr:hypothetical protein PINS_up021775 [Pythium insidiosum]